MIEFVQTVNRAAQWWWPQVWHATWQSSAVAAGLLAVGRLARRLPAHIRYALLLVALLKFAIPPALSLPVGLFSRLGPAVSMAPLPAFSADDAGGAPADGAVGLAGGHLSWRAWLMLVHLAGCAAAAGWIAWQLGQVRRMCRRAAPVSEGPLHDLLELLRRRMGLRRRVRLLLSPEPAAPMAFGILRPRIMCPESLLRDLPAHQTETVLAHELGHHRRGDLWVNWLQVLLAAAWWFNPAVWLLNRAIRRAREDCCDDLLLVRRLTTGGTYCQALLRVADELGRRLRIGGAPAFAERLHPLGGRIRRIMDSALPRRASLSWSAVPVVLAAACLLLPGLRTGASGPAGLAADKADGGDLAAAAPGGPPACGIGRRPAEPTGAARPPAQPAVGTCDPAPSVAGWMGAPACQTGRSAAVGGWLNAPGRRFGPACGTGMDEPDTWSLSCLEMPGLGEPSAARLSSTRSAVLAPESRTRSDFGRINRAELAAGLGLGPEGTSASSAEPSSGQAWGRDRPWLDLGSVAFLAGAAGSDEPPRPGPDLPTCGGQARLPAGQAGRLGTRTGPWKPPWQPQVHAQRPRGAEDAPPDAPPPGGAPSAPPPSTPPSTPPPGFRLDWLPTVAPGGSTGGSTSGGEEWLIPIGRPRLDDAIVQNFFTGHNGCNGNNGYNSDSGDWLLMVPQYDAASPVDLYGALAFRWEPGWRGLAPDQGETLPWIAWLSVPPTHSAVVAVPEPATLWLLAFAGLAAAFRRSGRSRSSA